MKCPQCGSSFLSKNGRRRDKQNYLCKHCGRQFLESYDQKGYSRDIKNICLKMHQNGMGFRAIERATGVNHNTVIHWYKKDQGSVQQSQEAQDISDECELCNSKTMRISKYISRLILSVFTIKYFISDNELMGLKEKMEYFGIDSTNAHHTRTMQDCFYPVGA